jgi:hypothetical protein
MGPTRALIILSVHATCLASIVLSCAPPSALYTTSRTENSMHSSAEKSRFPFGNAGIRGVMRLRGGKRGIKVEKKEPDDRHKQKKRKVTMEKSGFPELDDWYKQNRGRRHKRKWWVRVKIWRRAHELSCDQYIYREKEKETMPTCRQEGVNVTILLCVCMCVLSAS